MRSVCEWNNTHYHTLGSLVGIAFMTTATSCGRNTSLCVVKKYHQQIDDTIYWNASLVDTLGHVLATGVFFECSRVDTQHRDRERVRKTLEELCFARVAVLEAFWPLRCYSFHRVCIYINKYEAGREIDSTNCLKYSYAIEKWNEISIDRRRRTWGGAHMMMMKVKFGALFLTLVSIRTLQTLSSVNPFWKGDVMCSVFVYVLIAMLRRRYLNR